MAWADHAIASENATGWRGHEDFFCEISAHRAHVCSLSRGELWVNLSIWHLCVSISECSAIFKYNIQDRVCAL